MVFEYERQPLQSLYILYDAIITAFIRIPYWVMRFSLKKYRPRPSWSWMRSVLNAFLTHYTFASSWSAKVGLPKGPTHHAIVSGRGVKGVWVTPAPDLVVGRLKDWAEVARIPPERIPGYWQDRPGFDTPAAAAPSEGEKVFYSLHGGAFVSLSAHPTDILSKVHGKVVRLCPSAKRLFSLEYRLTTFHPETHYPFPTALIDALTGYNYLIQEVGFRPEDVIIIGDSAGANMALALVRHLMENTETHPNLPGLPYALVLLSPWADLGTSHETPGSSLINPKSGDYLPDPRTGIMSYARNAYCSAVGLAAMNSNPYLSPASIHADMPHVSFKGFPRSFILIGTAERFLDQVRTLRDRMVRDMGEGAGEGQVTYHEEPDAIHDFLAPPWEGPSHKGTLQKLEEWFNSW